MKALLQGIILVAAFLMCWLLLSQVRWVSTFRIDERKREAEEKLGNIFTDIFTAGDSEISDKFILNAIDSAISGIRRSNNLGREKIKVHIISNDEVNAFALPGRHIIIYTGLIEAAEGPDELLGVICHEMAHLELGHVMRKLAKEIGMNVLISMASGGGDPGILHNAASVLSSAAYDRKLEREADRMAADLMLGFGADPTVFAGFLIRITESGTELPAWLSTHPEASVRAQEINSRLRDQKNISGNTLFDTETFLKIKRLLSGETVIV